jgi:hypothetical protein
MIQVGDLVKHAIFQSPSGIGVVVDKQRNRYRVEWVVNPYSGRSPTIWFNLSELKLMENK